VIARSSFIFQAFNLIGDLTVYENVQLPLTYRSAWPWLGLGGDPLILRADEPTRNLDSQNGEAVMI
jgi:putative ABC transport system ATP-binding protein